MYSPIISNNRCTARLAALLVALSGSAVMAQTTDSNGHMAGAQYSGSARPELSASPIEGAWIFTNTLVNQGGVSFTALSLFSAGGVFNATGSNDRVMPISNLMGSWKRTEFNLFQSTAYFFAFDPTGNPVAMLKTNLTFQLTSSNELVGKGVVFACDVQGMKCVAVPAGAIETKGRRVVTETP